jgi:glycosyltransferase involved in cell wall biosynthesis
MPSVSVVIPTRHRPLLLARALGSVFQQSHTDFEILVVVDGPDEATCAMLASVADSRMRVIVNSAPRTAAGARNIGSVLLFSTTTTNVTRKNCNANSRPPAPAARSC